MSFEVHREPLYRRYYASAFSGACCYAFAFGFILIFLPLIIAYNSGRFWLKEDIIYEQPKVAYRYQSIIQMSGSSDGTPLNIFYSTSPTINKLNSGNLRVPLFQSAELDDNRDGYTDRIEIGVQMPLAPTESVNGFTALVYINTQLDAKPRYIFDAISYANYESVSSMRQLSMDGDLLLRQSWPLTVKGGFRSPYENDPLIELDTGVSAKDVSISSIMQRYNGRNLTMVYRSNYEQVTQRATSVATDHSSVPYFNATLTIRVPFQPIRFSPPVSDVLKNAW
eukprot:CAMPEP_0174970734 /NCGR_PEP_ID=MMETSP0004_2-20121128/9571_1 /TAXON_ID=420556 /ORGANISM="Ochromonas sp., Strain CCMP1393" /LENGTH=280 /DNA_ID=CAMNT_0016220545 /DNA_START=32 /DNA_END=871 /DNA_ORIENTATION=+